MTSCFSPIAENDQQHCTHYMYYVLLMIGPHVLQQSQTVRVSGMSSSTGFQQLNSMASSCGVIKVSVFAVLCEVDDVFRITYRTFSWKNYKMLAALL